MQLTQACLLTIRAGPLAGTLGTPWVLSPAWCILPLYQGCGSHSRPMPSCDWTPQPMGTHSHFTVLVHSQARNDGKETLA